MRGTNGKVIEVNARDRADPVDKVPGFPGSNTTMANAPVGSTSSASASATAVSAPSQSPSASQSPPPPPVQVQTSKLSSAATAAVVASTAFIVLAIVAVAFALCTMRSRRRNRRRGHGSNAREEQGQKHSSDPSTVVNNQTTQSPLSLARSSMSAANCGNSEMGPSKVSGRSLDRYFASGTAKSSNLQIHSTHSSSSASVASVRAIAWDNYARADSFSNQLPTPHFLISATLPQSSAPSASDVEFQNTLLLLSGATGIPHRDKVPFLLELCDDEVEGDSDVENGAKHRSLVLERRRF